MTLDAIRTAQAQHRVRGDLSPEEIQRATALLIAAFFKAFREDMNLERQQRTLSQIVFGGIQAKADR